jgi:hypothetical protein
MRKSKMHRKKEKKNHVFISKIINSHKSSAMFLSPKKKKNEVALCV